VQRSTIQSSFLISFVFALITFASSSAHAQKDSTEPIHFVGHGAMFDRTGTQIESTFDNVSKIQAWYRSNLLKKSNSLTQARFKEVEREFHKQTRAGEQERLVVNGNLLNWLAAHSPHADNERLHSKLLLLNRALKYSLPKAADGKNGASRNLFKVSGKLMEQLRQHKTLSLQTPKKALLVTDVSGEAYRKLCLDNGVPLPPDFGPASPWVDRGTISPLDLFIVRDLSAKVLTYESVNPPGLCIALPRFNSDNTVVADGIICQGQAGSDPSKSPKVCFWDNQDPAIPLNESDPTNSPDPTFPFPLDSAISTKRFAGGSDLRQGVGGVCSDCHAGSNPFVIHGKVLGALQKSAGINTFGKKWYQPIVRTGDTHFGAPLAWPENKGSTAENEAPFGCLKCHNALGPSGVGENVGRLPKLSPSLPGYCYAVLRSSVGALMPPLPGKPLNPPASMPPSNPGGLACTPDIPDGDPRKIACDEKIHTTICTPASLFKADRTIDPRVSDKSYTVKCTKPLADLLKRCDSQASIAAFTAAMLALKKEPMSILK
jgi:hypothetical protein